MQSINLSHNIYIHYISLTLNLWHYTRSLVVTITIVSYCQKPTSRPEVYIRTYNCNTCTVRKNTINGHCTIVPVWLYFWLLVHYILFSHTLTEYISLGCLSIWWKETCLLVSFFEILMNVIQIVYLMVSQNWFLWNQIYMEFVFFIM